MATALLSTFFSFAFLFLAYSSLPLRAQSSSVNGDEAVSHHHALTVASLLPSTVCISAKGWSDDGRSGLKVVHRHGPCSPLKSRNTPTHSEILTLDQSRVNSYRVQYSAASSRHEWKRSKPSRLIPSTKIPARPGGALGTGNYIVTIGFGTPRHDFSVIFDTGSDVTWIQCQPCVSSCYPQQEPIFDPSASSTYSNVSCSAAACSNLDSKSCSDNTCLYAVQYGDNSYTVGFYAQETLTISASDVLQNFRFGCGEKNRGLFGRAAGLLGLGRSSESFVSQSVGKYGGVFAYCLPSTSSATGFLNFGAAGAPASVKYTPMLADSSADTFYFLDLQAITVAGVKLSIPPSVFSSAGTLIDSGTVISRLPPTAYDALRSAFKKNMAEYPPAPPLSILDTCYDFSNYTTVTIPTVGLVFAGGVTVLLDPSGTLYVAKLSQACLAFAGNEDAGDFGIIGNVQQRKLNVVYNIPKKVIGFGPGGCS